MTVKLPFKKGASFSFGGTVALPAATTWTAQSQVRDAGGGLVADLTVTLTPLAPPTADATPAILLVTAADTSAWEGPLFFDVVYVSADGTSKVPSDTVEIDLQPGVTVVG
jgi:hypothetical protein